MNFNDFKIAVDNQFEKMQEHRMFKVDVSKQVLWDTYLGSFPEGSDPIYRERTHHDCQCCKQFIRTVGNVVAIVDGKAVSVWHCTVEDPNYQAVADAMAALVEVAPLADPFFHYEKYAGTDHTHQQEEDGTVKTWDHFFVRLPSAIVMKKDAIATRISNLRSNQQVFQRALTEIQFDAVDTILELIGQKSLYRGEEHLRTLTKFRDHMSAYARLTGDFSRTIYTWEAAFKENPAVLGIRNTSIGTLLCDLSGEMDLDLAVSRFEAMVAPSNYKRPTALITKTMIKKAQEQVAALGFVEALERRHATPEDITVNNVIFANRDARKAMGEDIFDNLIQEQPINPQSFSKVEEISIEDFISEVVPKATQIQLLLENRHMGNLMSLVAPVHPEANNMLKWENNFSWTYNGDITDSMKQRVKAAGGNVEGVMRFSIQWNDVDWNSCDYDAHCLEPGGRHIYFANKRQIHPSSGVLDVDIISPVKGIPAVENITWSDEYKMPNGTYYFKVHCYTRGSGNTGFTAEFEYKGQIRSYAYNKPLKAQEYIDVLKGELRDGEFTVTKELPTTLSSREVWGVPTMQYQNVSMMLYSPNHWDDFAVGNKHYFFILEGCKQPGKVRGFYNEFLTNKLTEHRKVFEVLGEKMKVEESDQQLSGLGFSSTQRNHVFAQVTGKFNRTVKVIF